MAVTFEKSGTVYFIGMRPWGDEDLPYYKIGFTGENEKDVDRRIREHQTGNPFRLEEHHAIPSEFAGGLEKWVQKKYAKYAVGQDDPTWKREWFNFESREQLKEAYDATVAYEELIYDTVGVYRPLKTKPSNGEFIEPTPEAITELEAWKELCSEGLKEERALKQMQSKIAISKWVGELLQPPSDEIDPKDDGKDKVAKKPAPDWDAIKTKFAAEWNECLKFRWSAKHRVKGKYRTRLNEVDPLTPEQQKVNAVERDMKKEDFNAQEHRGWVLSPEQKSELQELQKVGKRHLDHVEMDQSFIEMKLATMCGVNEGIEDFFVWKRGDVEDTAKTREEFRGKFEDLLIYKKETN